MKTKLPPKFKSEWIEALRSGEYTQGNGVLYDAYSHSFCCLGVACRVRGISLSSLESKGLIADGHLSMPLRKKMPVMLRGSNTSENSTHNRVVEILTDMNDLDDKDFHDIADFIEDNY